MIRGRRRPAPPLPRKRVVAVPGHRLEEAAYEGGLATWHCECGVRQPPLPPTTTAAQRYDHLEVHVAKNTDPTKFVGQPLANAGRSILEIVWELLDATYAELMEGAGKKTAGKAAGLAEAIAVMTNPYEMDVDAVKAQAHARWESSGMDEDDTEPEEG